MISFNFANHMHILNSDVFFCSKTKEQEAGIYSFLKFVLSYVDCKHVYNISFHCFCRSQDPIEISRYVEVS